MPDEDAPWWTARVRRLEGLGFCDVNDWVSDPAVQFSAWVVPERKWCYLRLRGGQGSLKIMPADRAWQDIEWSGRVDYVESSDPCHVDEPELIASVAAQLLDAWRRGVPSDPRF